MALLVCRYECHPAYTQWMRYEDPEQTYEHAVDFFEPLLEQFIDKYQLWGLENDENELVSVVLVQRAHDKADPKDVVSKNSKKLLASYGQERFDMLQRTRSDMWKARETHMSTLQKDGEMVNYIHYIGFDPSASEDGGSYHNTVSFSYKLSQLLIRFGGIRCHTESSSAIRFRTSNVFSRIRHYSAAL
jgi:hypothetical protein